MDRQTGGMRTGTGQLVKLKVKNNRIIKGLRNLIAIPDKNGYHSIVNRHRLPVYVSSSRPDFLRVQACYFFM